VSVTLLRGHAARLPLPDSCVDLIVGSPPYWQLRDYRDGGQSLPGQLGNEATWQEYIANLLTYTAEWMRVLKPSGSIFMVIGDKYGRGTRTTVHGGNSKQAYVDDQRPGTVAPTGHEKSMLGLPERYALGCADQLGLTRRAAICWAKVNGLPESVTDRVRLSHEMIYHFTLGPRYYTAVDEIREPHAQTSIKRAEPHRANPGRRPASIYQASPAQTLDLAQMNNPLGKLPGSVLDTDDPAWVLPADDGPAWQPVWYVSTQPLYVPDRLGTDHYAAYPMELPRRLITGWCPPAICTVCGQGRFPVSLTDRTQLRMSAVRQRDERGWHGDGADPKRTLGPSARERNRRIIGYACACTPHTDHPATKRGVTLAAPGSVGVDPRDQWTGRLDEREEVGPWREYQLDGWAPPPSRAAVVLDPFSGTGTTAMVADALGRRGIGVDLSEDYCKIARWRVNDPGERAKAHQVPKPPPVPPGQEALLDL
jgi:DNA modification methylase